MKIAIVNGPNLNLVGTREPAIYGTNTFENWLLALQEKNTDHSFTYFQNNVEGELINHLHNLQNKVDAIVINPGGYSHTSVALADAIAAITIPCIEVHISNIYARETMRHQSITGAKCVGVISGLGLKSYDLAIQYFINT